MNGSFSALGMKAEALVSMNSTLPLGNSGRARDKHRPRSPVHDEDASHGNQRLRSAAGEIALVGSWRPPLG